MAYIIQTKKELEMFREILTKDYIEGMFKGKMARVGKGVLPYPWEEGTEITVHLPLK